MPFLLLSTFISKNNFDCVVSLISNFLRRELRILSQIWLLLSKIVKSSTYVLNTKKDVSSELINIQLSDANGLRPFLNNSSFNL